MESKKELLSYLENLSLFIVGILFFCFPLIFSSATTDSFVLPKQILIAIAVTMGILLLSAKMLVDGKIRLRGNPFGLPILLILVIFFLSAMLSANKYDALISYVPFLFAVLSYFLVINAVRTKNNIIFALSALLAGAAISAVFSTLSFFKIYLLPLSYTHTQVFTTFGALLDQAIYFAIVLPLGLYMLYPLLMKRIVSSVNDFSGLYKHEKKPFTPKTIFFAAASGSIAVGLVITIYMLLTIQKPFILPFETGFQTAFATISQDSGRVLESFLVGSGFGTYINDFNRFKLASFNLNQDLWSLTFLRSSSFILELLATTGLLGLASFLFLIYRIVKEKSFFLPMLLLIVASLILPFSYLIVALFFIMLGLFVSIRAFSFPAKYPDVEIYFVALKRGLLIAMPEKVASEEETADRQLPESRVSYIAVIGFAIILLCFGLLGYMSVRYVLADLDLQKSLVAASQNNGSLTYQLEANAINTFPYRDASYRIFSQTNLALANSVAASLPQNSSPSSQMQQNILTLIQQSINSGRQAVTIAPQTSLNWSNLSGIYRSLIGFGANASQFTILTNQQAIALDPNNPEQYINLGGVYYQLHMWDDAIRQFQIAINLKPDLANAYYNLGHALEQKGDLTNALTVYQTVKTLAASSPDNTKKMAAEIDALQNKIGDQNKKVAGAQTGPTPAQTQNNQQPLGINTPQAQLPERKPPVKIPGPTVSPIPSPSTSLSPKPTGTGESTTPSPSESTPTP